MRGIRPPKSSPASIAFENNYSLADVVKGNDIERKPIVKSLWVEYVKY